MSVCNRLRNDGPDYAVEQVQYLIARKQAGPCSGTSVTSNATKIGPDHAVEQVWYPMLPK